MADGSDSGSSGYVGQIGDKSSGSHYNTHHFLSEQTQGYQRTAMLVKVMKVHPNKDDPMMPPTIDVWPIVKQTDGQGNAISHGMIYGIPIRRHQAGDCVIICDPIVGDIGHMDIHDRDISSAVSSQSESNPGSPRRFSPSDGVYHGTIGSKTKPKHFVQFERDKDGNVTSVNLTSPAQYNINGAVIDAKGNITTPGFIKATGDITAGNGTGDSVTLQQHKHTQVQPGGGISGVPQAGT